jgi:hypothetical protein
MGVFGFAVKSDGGFVHDEWGFMISDPCSLFDVTLEKVSH